MQRHKNDQFFNKAELIKRAWKKICSQLCNEKALNILKSDTHQILTNCSIHNTTRIPRRWFSRGINIKISPLS